MQFFWNNINITIQTIFNIKNPQKFLIPIIWRYQKKELQVSAVVYIFKRGKKKKKKSSKRFDHNHIDYDG